MTNTTPDPALEQQITDMKLVMDIMTQQAILRGQMEAFASVMEILAPEMGVMPVSASVAAMVSIAASEWSRPLLAELHMTVGGLESDIKVVKVQELGTVIALKGLELARAHEMVSEVLADQIAQMAKNAEGQL